MKFIDWFIDICIAISMTIIMGCAVLIIVGLTMQLLQHGLFYV